MKKTKRNKKQITEKMYNKVPGLLLILRVIKRVIKRDKNYIYNSLALVGDNNPDYVKIDHNGKTNYGKIIYLINENGRQDGFCATLRYIMLHLIFADQHGFVPKIEFTSDFLYYDIDKEEIANPFDYYFIDNSTGYDYKTALNVCDAKYYYIMTLKEYDELDAYKKENYYNKTILKTCSDVINKYLLFKPEIINDSISFLKNAKENSRKILGVQYRGTDYKVGYKGQPKGVSDNQLFQAINHAISEMHYSAIFLATDDINICKAIRNGIDGNIEVLFYEDVCRSDGNISVAFSKNKRKFHKYLLGYEVARDIYTLSLCDGLLSGMSSVSFVSNIYKFSRGEEYEFINIIDNGIYSEGDDFRIPE